MAIDMDMLEPELQAAYENMLRKIGDRFQGEAIRERTALSKSGVLTSPIMREAGQERRESRRETEMDAFTRLLMPQLQERFRRSAAGRQFQRQMEQLGQRQAFQASQSALGRQAAMDRLRAQQEFSAEQAKLQRQFQKDLAEKQRNQSLWASGLGALGTIGGFGLAELMSE